MKRKSTAKALCDYPGYSKNKTDDSGLIKDLHKLFDEADILIAHNGDRFDRRKSNSRFVGCGLPPPSPYKTIDTLKVARRQFMQGSNSLQSLGEFLGLGGKLPTTGWHLWRSCIDGDLKSWDTLKKYNRRDVSFAAPAGKDKFPRFGQRVHAAQIECPRTHTCPGTARQGRCVHSPGTCARGKCVAKPISHKLRI